MLHHKNENQAFAYLASLKSSPIKLRRLTRGLIGLSVSNALRNLDFCSLKSAKPIRSLLYSAVSNAENNHNMNVDSLVVSKIDVGRAFALKRFSPRARGRSSRLLKTFSNVRIAVTEKKMEVFKDGSEG